MSPSPSAAAENPSSPSSPAAIPASSLFLPPKGPAAPLPPPSPSSLTSSPQAETSSPLGDAGEGASWSGDYEASEATSPDPSDSSDTPSTGSGLSVSRAGLRAAIGQGLRTVTRVISRIAASPVEQSQDLWRADDDDVKEISTPAARVIWRRVPAEARSSDTVDLVVLALALVGYVAKNLDTRLEIRRAQARGELPTDEQLVASEAVGPVS